MDWIKNFDLERWWNAVIAVGLAILPAALALRITGAKVKKGCDVVVRF
jgi:hypothetical protein